MEDSSTARQNFLISPSAKEEQLILVDENDRQIGVGGKMQTHLEGVLHRAFSIFVFDDDRRLLLQKRAQAKYHSGGLWSNTCCGHPRAGEPLLEAARRRLGEEMNFQCDLHEFFAFQYRVELENNLIENEYDHVLIGKFNGSPMPDPAEAEDWKWIDFRQLKLDLQENSLQYSYWLRAALEKNEWRLLDDFLLAFS